MLKIANISKSFPRKNATIQAVQDFSLTIRPGEIATVQGPSGCGKTTLLLVAAGLLHPDSGSVQVEDVSLYALGREERASFRSEQIGVVFQQFHLMPYLNVMDNILVPAWVAKKAAGDKARALIEEFGLTDRISHKPAELSVGERQRTAVARALMMSPSLILADEPTANLDQANADIVLKALSRFAQSGKSVLMVSHDPRVSDFSDHTVNLLVASASLII